jgi:hypothetical protein
MLSSDMITFVYIMVSVSSRMMGPTSGSFKYFDIAIGFDIHLM